MSDISPTEAAPWESLQIRQQQLELLLVQSYPAAFTSPIISLVLAAILWPVQDHRTLAIWTSLILISAVLRILLFRRYREVSPARHQVVWWERAYFILMAIYFASWGVGALWLMPGDSPIHQVVICYFLIGLAGSAVSVFSANRVMMTAACCIILLPGLAWMSLRGDLISVGMALAGLAFLVSALRSARVLTSAIHQNMKLNQQLTRSKDEVENHARAITHALARAEDANNAKTRFLAAASHDLRQPIHTLSMLSASLGLRELDPRAREISESIDHAITALGEQLDALLDVSKLDAGVIGVKQADLPLTHLLVALQKEFSTVADERKITIVVDSPDAASVHTDGILLERILRNLMSNAIKHNYDCTLALTVFWHDGHWNLVVSDTGQGIPVAEQERIFEEFYQVDNPERDRSRGLGLGLSIVQRLTSLLGVPMSFESETGKGTRFTLELKSGKAIEAVERPVQNPPTPLTGLSILVVDDEASVRHSTRTLLETSGCSVVSAAGTRSAIAAVARHVPDVALVDFRLQGDDNGLATIEGLREHIPGLPAILVSGDTAPEQLHRAAQAGVTMLTKPVSMEQLREAIHHVYQQAPLDASPDATP